MNGRLGCTCVLIIILESKIRLNLDTSKHNEVMAVMRSWGVREIIRGTSKRIKKL